MAKRGVTSIALALLGAALRGRLAGRRRPATRLATRWRRARWSGPRSAPARVGDRIYVVGGFVPDGGSTGRMARYDISEDAWTEVAPLPIAVNHPGVTAHRGFLYVTGGFTDAGGPSDRLYRYDPERDRWRRLPDMPTARGALGFVGIGGRLYAAGGMTADDRRVPRPRDLRHREAPLEPRAR